MSVKSYQILGAILQQTFRKCTTGAGILGASQKAAYPRYFAFVKHLLTVNGWMNNEWAGVMNES